MQHNIVSTYLLYHDPFLEVVPLGCYLVFVYFAFCDGFAMRPARKIIWAVYFLSFSLLSLFTTERFDLRLIISLSSLLAFVLALFQKRENQLKGK